MRSPGGPREVHGRSMGGPREVQGQCATENPVPVPVPVLVDPVDFFKSGSGPVPAKYRPDRPDLTSKFGCRI